MKIAIGSHVGEAIAPLIYFNHISALTHWAKKYDLLMLGTWRQKVANARNTIMEQAIKNECTHVFFLDSDHLLADNLLDLLVDNADAAMISGLICKRYFPFETVAYRCTNDGEIQQCIISARNKVIEVDACAMGCTLINLDIVKRLMIEGKLKKSPFYDAHFRSDLNFCSDLRKANEKVLLDTRTSVGHLGDPPVITPENAQEQRESYVKAGKWDE